MFKPIFCWIIWKWEEGGRRYRRGSDRFVLVHRKIRFRFVLVHRKIRFVLEEGGRRYREGKIRVVLVHRKIEISFIFSEFILCFKVLISSLAASNSFRKTRIASFLRLISSSFSFFSFSLAWFLAMSFKIRFVVSFIITFVTFWCLLILILSLLRIIVAGRIM